MTLPALVSSWAMARLATIVIGAGALRHVVMSDQTTLARPALC